MPLKPPSLVRNISHVFTGNVVYAFCQWLMLALLTKLMSPISVGEFALGTAVSAPVIVLTQLQLRSVQATDTAGDQPLGLCLAVRVLTSAVALVFIWLACIIADYPVETTRIIWAVTAAKTIESFSDVLFGAIQQRERMDLISVSLCLKGLLSIVVFGPLLLITHNLFYSLIALSLAWAAVLFSYDFPQTAGLLRSTGERPRMVAIAPGVMIIRPEWRCREVLNIALRAMPLGLSSFLYTLAFNIPRYVLEKSNGISDLGIYAALSYLIVAGNLVINAVGTAAIPKLSGYFARGQMSSFYRLLLKLTGMCAALGVAGEVVSLLWGRPLLLLIYRREYAANTALLCWVAAAAGIGFVASMLGYGFFTTRRFALQVPIHSVTAAATLVASLLLIPRYAGIGASWALSIGSSVCCVLTALALASATMRRARDLNRAKSSTDLPFVQLAG